MINLWRIVFGRFVERDSARTRRERLGGGFTAPAVAAAAWLHQGAKGPSGAPDRLIIARAPALGRSRGVLGSRSPPLLEAVVFRLFGSRWRRPLFGLSPVAGQRLLGRQAARSTERCVFHPQLRKTRRACLSRFSASSPHNALPGAAGRSSRATRHPWPGKVAKRYSSSPNAARNRYGDFSKYKFAPNHPNT